MLIVSNQCYIVTKSMQVDAVCKQHAPLFQLTKFIYITASSEKIMTTIFCKKLCDQCVCLCVCSRSLHTGFRNRMLTSCVWGCANLEGFFPPRGWVPLGRKKVAWEKIFNNSANLLRAARIALSWAMHALWLAVLAWRHGRAGQEMTGQRTCVCVSVCVCL